MNFLVISSAPLIKKGNTISAYTPYVNELNIWEETKNIDFSFCCPIWQDDRGLLNKKIEFNIDKIFELQEFHIKNKSNFFEAILKSIKNIFTLYKAMRQAEHIHLRCPGNMGLLGCVVQILFPRTPKTAKYAGNWDPRAKQPWSYKLQKWILSNTVLTKNMQVLVYGEWPNQTKNIKSFFTASYHEDEKEDIYIRNYTQKLKFCFIGSLSKGKRPQLALELIYQLQQNDIDVEFNIYGNGDLKPQLQDWIIQHDAQSWAKLHGNQPKNTIKKALKYSHFMILPSQSEGWPKAVAEAMFWGCIPIVPRISCVPWMLAEGQRGILIKNDLESDVEHTKSLIGNPEILEQMSKSAAKWSRQYTLDRFEEEIKKLLIEKSKIN